MMKQTDLVQYSTISQMVSTWEKSRGDIIKAFNMLNEAEDMLGKVFGEHDVYFNRDLLRSRRIEEFLNDLNRKLWRALIEKSEIRRVLSIKRSQEIDRKIETGDLPDFTEDEVANMLEVAYSNAQKFAEEMVVEVFEYLRPHDSGYRNNEKFAAELGKRVVLGSAVYYADWMRKFRPSYYYEKELRAVDNVFHALDGKGFSKSYRGELCDAIDGCDGQGETEYFRFKCFKNGNLHIEFKRMDLVKKMNAIVKERSLKPSGGQQ